MHITGKEKIRLVRPTLDVESAIAAGVEDEAAVTIGYLLPG
jgi:hypothetical protein